MNRWLIGAALCFAARCALAGTYVELFDHDLKTNSSQLAQKMYVQDGNGRFVDTEGRTTLIKGNTMYILDDSDKTYIAFDKATMQELAKKIKAAMDKAKEQISKLPPEQRAQAEQMMGGPMAGMDADTQKYTVDAVDTGKSDKVEGRACKVWDIKRNGQLDDQYCVAAFSALPGKENFQTVFANFAKVFEEMTKTVPMLSGMMANEFDALSKVNGYPVRTRGYSDGKLEDTEHLVKTWREESMPASLFDIPAGYKQKQMPMGGE
jgi:hypothetical protein